MTMDVGWALRELDRFLGLTELYRPPDPPGIVSFSRSLSNRADQADIVPQAQVVEQILDRVLPSWRVSVPADDNAKVNRWCQHREAVQRARAALKRREEVQEKFGEARPQLTASRLHPWIWEGARSLWESKHYREAVRAAAVKLNAETQNKCGRYDIAETDLFNQLFTLDPPKSGAPRLRVGEDTASNTFESFHRGIRAFAEGCYAAIRNPISHTEGALSEDHGLEQLASFSVLARWVDVAHVEK